MAHDSNDFWAAIEPVANRKFYGIGEKTPAQFSKIFRIGSDDEPQTSFVEYGSVNTTLSLKTENAAVTQRTTSQGPVKTWNTQTFAGAATISMEAAKDVKNRYPKLG